MRERIGYYDIARGLGIIFVIIGHIDTFYVPFRSVVITFHMALFFIISGMLFMETEEEKKSFREILKKKFCRILVPYYLFSLLAIGIEFIRLALQEVFYWPHFKSLLLSTFSLYGNSVMWFLPALFISEVLFLAIRKLTSDFVTIVSVVLMTALAVWGNMQEIVGGEFSEEITAAFFRGIFCIFFICLGYYARKYMPQGKMPVYSFMILGSLLLGISVFMSKINPKVDLRAMYWGEAWISTESRLVLEAYHVLLYLVGAVSGALGVIFLCRGMERLCNNGIYRVLAFFGCNSLIIMATHLDFHILHFGTDLAEAVNKLYPHAVLYHGIILLFVFTVETALIIMINKYVPVLSGKHKKINF